MKKQRKSRGLGMTFIIVCLVLSGCGAGTQEAALGSAEEYVQAAKTALAGQDSFMANFERDTDEATLRRIYGGPCQGNLREGAALYESGYGYGL